MKRFQDLHLPPGELLFIDSLHDGIARLIIGEDGERVETIRADDLLEQDREAGIYLRVGPDGQCVRDTERERSSEEEAAVLMEEIFGEPPPE